MTVEPKLLDRLAAQVLAEHVRNTDSGPAACYRCDGVSWPCPTVALLLLLGFTPRLRLRG